MVNKKISVNRKVFTKNISHKKKYPKIKSGMGVDLYNPTKALIDEERIGRAIWECLKNGDSKGVIEIIQIHLKACNKTLLAKQARMPKTTLYHSFRNKNPTIRTLAKLVHACA